MLLSAMAASVAMHAAILFCGPPLPEVSGETGRERLIVSFGSEELPEVTARVTLPEIAKPPQEAFQETDPPELPVLEWEDDPFPLKLEDDPLPAMKQELARVDEELLMPPEALAWRTRPENEPPSVRPSDPEPPGTPAHTAGRIRNARAAYLTEVASRLQEAKRYPETARRDGTTGTAKVAFVLSEEGRVLSARIVNSAGNTTLDSEALATVERAAPYPRIPEELDLSEFRLTVPIAFRLKGRR